ncbi:hypothetical protein ACQKIE_16050 [Luteibacter sp. NPDC031894]|uniref:hypothetical protein n=1 Tax=Luteibacter sp. NPDC031894 TaxID=3390572 RepID=UPI003CFEB54E
MAQGWNIDNTAHTITFLEPPAAGAPITVKEYAQGSVNASDLWALGAWGDAVGYPGEVEFFASRLFFAGTMRNPQTIWSTKINNYNNFGKSVPTADDDAITATLNAKQVNAITDLIPLDNMIMLTTGGEWKTGGGSNDVLTPSTVSFKPQSKYGAAKVPGLVVGDTGLFIQGRGSYVRDIGYQFAVDSYTGSDLTIFASHLVQGHRIVDWTYQQAPFSVVWAVRDDGVLLGLAYFKEQQVSGWFHCDTTNGFYESVCSITEGDTDVVYVIVRRVINGQTVRYVERMGDRFFTDQRDAFFVDAGLSYDGRNTNGFATSPMTLSGGVTWSDQEDLTLYCPTSRFSTASVGAWVKLYGSGTDPRVVEIRAYQTPNLVTVRGIGNIEPEFRNTPIAVWDYCPIKFAGLDHLEGQTVSILADGNVVLPRKVAAGALSLDHPAAVVHIGLPIVADFETLEVNVIGQESVRDKRKTISKVSLVVNQTRGLKVGPGPSRLRETPPRVITDGYYNPNSLQNDLVEAYIDTTFSTSGRVFVREDDPLPACILGVIPDVSVAGG